MSNFADTRAIRSPASAADKEKVLTKAIIRAADWLNLTSAVIAKVLGVSTATVSRMKSGTYSVRETDKSYELGALFVRVYRSLYGILAGHQQTAQEWMLSYNTALKGIPLDLIKTVRGLNDVCSYLDARRSVV